MILATLNQQSDALPKRRTGATRCPARALDSSHTINRTLVLYVQLRYTSILHTRNSDHHAGILVNGGATETRPPHQHKAAPCTGTCGCEIITMITHDTQKVLYMFRSLRV
jgi:hypothetical protein